MNLWYEEMKKWLNTVNTKYAAKTVIFDIYTYALSVFPLTIVVIKAVILNECKKKIMHP